MGCGRATPFYGSVLVGGRIVKMKDIDERYCTSAQKKEKSLSAETLPRNANQLRKRLPMPWMRAASARADISCIRQRHP